MITFFRRTSLARQLHALLIARARPIRFACVGGTSALIQLSLLHLIVGRG